MSAFLPHTVRLRPVLAGTDAALLALAAWGAHLVRFGAHIRGEKWSVVVNHPGLWLTAVGLLWALATAAELYEPLRLRARAELAARVLVVGACWGGALALAMYHRETLALLRLRHAA